MKTIDSLRTTLAKFPAEYARGRAGHDALAGHATPEDVLLALRLGSSLSHAERDAITLALVGEHQRAAHPLWSSILLVAYEPMLAGVWKRLFDKRDAESRLVLGFLEAIGKVSLAHPPSHLALALRHAVERSVFGTAAAGAAPPEFVSMREARRERSQNGPEDAVIRSDEHRRIAEELAALFGDDAKAVLDVLVCARTGREALVAFIAERYPGLTSRESARLYADLQSMRRRALTHLGERFASSA